MSRTIRQKLSTIAASAALAMGALLAIVPAANAAPGTVTSNVNVRSGPGTNFAVVSTARRGTQVDVQQCQQSWCYVQGRGVTGWVSANYLSAAGGAPVNPAQPGISFGFSTGPNGPNFSFGIGNQPQQPQRPTQRPRPPVIQPVVAEVCFFEQGRYRGNSFCMNEGESRRDLGRWTDRISSIQNSKGARVEVCSEPNYRNCRVYTTNASSLGDFDDYIASIRIR
jgi:uncharacterized protein YraI